MLRAEDCIAPGSCCPAQADHRRQAPAGPGAFSAAECSHDEKSPALDVHRGVVAEDGGHEVCCLWVCSEVNGAAGANRQGTRCCSVKRAGGIRPASLSFRCWHSLQGPFSAGGPPLARPQATVAASSDEASAPSSRPALVSALVTAVVGRDDQQSQACDSPSLNLWAHLTPPPRRIMRPSYLGKSQILYA